MYVGNENEIQINILEGYVLLLGYYNGDLIDVVFSICEQ